MIFYASYHEASLSPQPGRIPGMVYAWSGAHPTYFGLVFEPMTGEHVYFNNNNGTTHSPFFTTSPDSRDPDKTNCDNKNIKQLIADGQTFNFVKN